MNLWFGSRKKKELGNKKRKEEEKERKGVEKGVI